MSKKSSKNNGLTEFQELFCQHYIVDYNATQAYLRCKPNVKETTASSEGSKLLGNPKVIDQLKKLNDKKHKKVEITADRIAKLFLEQAELDIAECYDEHGKLKPIHEMPEHIRRNVTIESFEEYEYEGRDKVYTGDTKKVHVESRTKGREMLAKHIGFFKDADVTINISVSDRIKKARARVKK